MSMRALPTPMEPPTPSCASVACGAGRGRVMDGWWTGGGRVVGRVVDGWWTGGGTGDGRVADE